MKKNIVLLLIGVVSFMLIGMSSQPKMIVFEKDDNDRQIQLAAKQKFTVILPANPSTGYRWIIAETDSACFRECQADTFLLRSNHEKDGAILVGAGGYQQFFFQAAAPGECELHMHYQRAWEKKQPPADTFRMRLQIRE